MYIKVDIHFCLFENCFKLRIKKLPPRTGFEPAAVGLRVQRSTTELPRIHLVYS